MKSKKCVISSLPLPFFFLLSNDKIATHLLVFSSSFPDGTVLDQRGLVFLNTHFPVHSICSCLPKHLLHKQRTIHLATCPAYDHSETVRHVVHIFTWSALRLSTSAPNSQLTRAHTAEDSTRFPEVTVCGLCQPALVHRRAVPCHALCGSEPTFQPGLLFGTMSGLHICPRCLDDSCSRFLMGSTFNLSSCL